MAALLHYNLYSTEEQKNQTDLCQFEPEQTKRVQQSHTLFFCCLCNAWQQDCGCICTGVYQGPSTGASHSPGKASCATQKMEKQKCFFLFPPYSQRPFITASLTAKQFFRISAVLGESWGRSGGKIPSLFKKILTTVVKKSVLFCSNFLNEREKKKLPFF